MRGILLIIALIFVLTSHAQDAKALYEEGMKYTNAFAISGEDSKKNDSLATICFRQSAELGYAKAQTKMGEAYEFGGRGVPTNAALAVQWYQKAAEQGDTLGALRYAVCFYQGVGIPQNF